jgi:hypothetical protein
VHIAEKQQGVVGSKKPGEHHTEMVDSTGMDNGEDEVRLATLRHGAD